MIKPFAKLTITTYTLFCTVMHDAELCKYLLRLLLSSSTGQITEIHYQRTVAQSSGAKSMQLDLIAGATESTIDNIQMQVSDRRSFAKLCRYHHSIPTINFLSRGKDYNDLQKTYIVFLCAFGYFKKGIPVYPFKPHGSDTRSIMLQDRITKVQANSRACVYEETTALKAFFGYMQGIKGTSAFIHRLKAKQSRHHICYYHHFLGATRILREKIIAEVTGDLRIKTAA